MEHLEIPPFITYAIPFFFLLMLIEMGIGLITKKHFYSFSDTISDLSTGIYSQVVGIFLKTISLFAYLYIYENLKLFEISMDSIIGWIFSILLWDFLYYWYHRLAHEVNIFWAGHVIHHHSEEYNLVVALRQTSTGGVISWIFFIPMAFIGIPPWMFLASGQINLIYQYWVHTKAIKSMGRIGEFFLSTPSHHRVHHAINPEYIDKNHGGIFIVWDRIFGTFQKEEKEPVYGTVKPFQSFNPLWANFHYYIEMWNLSKKANGIINKLKVFIMPPGWIPPTEQKNEYYLPIPEVDSKTFIKFNPLISYRLKPYLFIWFVVVLSFSFVYLLIVNKLTNIEKIYFSFWIVFSLLPVNGMLENKKWSFYLEAIRLILTPIVFYFFFTEYYFSIVFGVLAFISSVYLFFYKKDFILKSQSI
jgi:alkylglycerol monooxygenase